MISTVRLEEALVGRLERAARARPGEEVLLLAGGRIVAGAEPARVDVPVGTSTVDRGGVGFRAAAVSLIDDRPDVVLATMMPLAAINRAADDKRNDVLLALLASLVTLALVVVAAVIWRRQRRLAIQNARDRERAAQRSRRALARR